MNLTVLTLGHGGGVPYYQEEPHGNTNFALFPGVGKSDVPNLEGKALSNYLLMKHPFWLVDCGPETAALLCKTQSDGTSPIKNLQGIMLTHCHADHSLGLPTIAWRTFFVEGTRPYLLATNAVLDLFEKQALELTYFNAAQLCKMQDKVAAYGPPSIHWFFKVGSIQPLGGSFHPPMPSGVTKPMKVHFNEVDHNIPNFPGVSISVTGTNGNVVVFSGDTAYPLNLAWNSENLLAVYHDVQFYNEGDGLEVHCPFNKLDSLLSNETKSKVRLAHCAPAATNLSNFKWAYQHRVETFEL